MPAHEQSNCRAHAAPTLKSAWRQTALNTSCSCINSPLPGWCLLQERVPLRLKGNGSEVLKLGPTKDSTAITYFGRTFRDLDDGVSNKERLGGLVKEGEFHVRADAWDGAYRGCY